MDIIISSFCNKCSTESEQTPLHMFYHCESVKPFFLWILRCLYRLCNFKPSSNIKFIYFDTVYSSSFQKNICNVFLYVYIITIWRTRKEHLRIGNLKSMVVSKVSQYRGFLKHLPRKKYYKISKDVSSLDLDNLLQF